MGTIWVDQVSLMPDDKDTVKGWRKDVVEAVKAIKPGNIRWGGSTTECYDWRNLIGDPDRRVPWQNEPWKGIYPTGVGLEEFVQFCHLVDSEPMICVRVTGVQPGEAAAQVEYFNGATNTPMGRLRADNGHPRPYNVKYWQVGNEVHSDADRLIAFCEAMKAVDPSIILLSSYPSEDIIRKAGKYIDYVCPHHYGIWNLPQRDAEIENMRLLLAKYGLTGKVKMAVTEWNTTAGQWGIRRHHLWTLDNALAVSRYHNMIHRDADMVEIAHRSNLTGSYCCGILQANNHRLFLTPAYYSQQLYSIHGGVHPLKVELEGDLIPNDVSATLSRDKKSMTLFVVNDKHLERNVTINLSELGLDRQYVSIWTLVDTQKAAQRDAINSFDQPKRVRPVASKISIESAEFDYTFEPLSLTVMEFKLK
jgi:alpha-N-arabinofuranosidase